MTRLFVYGSLLRGEPNHAVLDGAPYVGDARTTGSLYDLGAYPALVAQGAHAVVGEVYELDDAHLVRLDAFEDEYRRVTLELDDGTFADAYVMDAAQVANRPIVPFGDWRASARSNRHR